MLERRSNNALVRARGALNDGAGRLRRPGQSVVRVLRFGVGLAVGGRERGGKRVDEGPEPMQRHQEDDGLAGHIRWRIGTGALAARARANEDLISDGAMGRWDGREQGRAERRRDARQDGREVAVLSEEVEFLAAAAVDVGIALLEADDDLAGLEGVQAHAQELFLRLLRVAGEFARDVDFGAAGDEVEDGGGDELVGEDEVRGLDCAVRGEREEVWVSGAGAGEDDAAFAAAVVEGGGVEGGGGGLRLAAGDVG